MTAQTDLIGQPVQELDTPALLVDLDVMEGNIRRMAAYFAAHGVSWRPHTKGGEGSRDCPAGACSGRHWGYLCQVGRCRGDGGRGY